MDLHLFSWIDYTIFVIITSISCCIGLYFAFYSKQKTANDYLLGGKNMKWLPVSISVASCVLSGQTILGLATEVYLHGSQTFLMLISVIIVNFVNYYFFLPVFYNLQFISVFQYLEKRFNVFVKNIIAFIMTTTIVMILPLHLYPPSLALSQVTGISIYTIQPIMTSLCVFYTTIGGVKAVVWTHAVQLSVTVLTIMTVIVLGIISIGGFKVLVERARDGDRLTFFEFNPDPTVRITFWSTILGYTVSWCATSCISPPEVQRSLSLPRTSLTKFVTMFTIVLVTIKLTCMFMGLVIYGMYFDCDPQSIGKIEKADQVVPHFVAELTYYIPGFSGLFIASIFGSAFSILSTYLHAMSGVIYNDIAPWFVPKKLLDIRPGLGMKVIVVLLGIISVSLMYLIEKIGSIFEIIYYLKGITAGTVLGVFALGLFIPFANTKGVVSGGIASITLMSTIIINNQIYKWNGGVQSNPKPMHTYGCPSNTTVFNTTITPTINDTLQKPFWLFQISFQYYDLVGTFTTLLVGMFISWLTKRKFDAPANPKYISPIIRKFFCKYDVTDEGHNMKALKTIQSEPKNTAT